MTINSAMHSLRGLLAIAALCWIVGGCTTLATDRDVGIRRTQATADAATTFVIVRHAEKYTDDAKDPSLSEAGLARARHASARFADRRVAAVYATGYRRTQMTAAQTAQAHGLSIVTYDAAQPEAEFAAQLRRAHTAGVVLVVGHSNTVAGIAGALCVCAVSPLREDEYDRWIEIRIGPDGAIKLEQTRY